jgi:anti-sigma B factor antagonist
MKLEIVSREREGIILLDLKGRLTAGQDVSVFRAAVDGILVESDAKIVFNLHSVDYIDSTGLGALVMCSTQTRNAGGIAKLLNLNRRNVELLVLTKLDTIFEVFDDEIDAVNSFFPDREIKRFDILSFVQKMKKEDL